MNPASPPSLSLLLIMPAALLASADTAAGSTQQQQVYDAISVIKEISVVFSDVRHVCKQVNNGTLSVDKALDRLDELSQRASAIKQRSDAYEAQCRAEGCHERVTLQLSEYVESEEGSLLHSSMRSATLIIRKTMRTTSDARLHDALNQFFASMS